MFCSGGASILDVLGDERRCRPWHGLQPRRSTGHIVKQETRPWAREVLATLKKPCARRSREEGGGGGDRHEQQSPGQNASQNAFAIVVHEHLRDCLKISHPEQILYLPFVRFDKYLSRIVRKFFIPDKYSFREPCATFKISNHRQIYPTVRTSITTTRTHTTPRLQNKRACTGGGKADRYTGRPQARGHLTPPLNLTLYLLSLTATLTLLPPPKGRGCRSKTACTCLSTSLALSCARMR